MPEMGGIELAGHIADKWPRLKVAYMSGYAEGDKLQSGPPEFERSFLPKPFSAESLMLKVRELLDAEAKSP
jgi:DNA-binding NtrC family response regulator